MSFWTARYIKRTRKSHVCMYCGRTIKVWESCYSESGMYEREFQSYYFCARCDSYIGKYIDCTEGISTLHDELVNGEILRCPACGKSNLRAWEYAEDVMSCDCECDDCDHKWVQDLSFEALERLVEQR